MSQAAETRARLHALFRQEKKALNRIDADAARLLRRAGLDGAAALQSLQSAQSAEAREAERRRQIDRLAAKSGFERAEAARRADLAWRAALKLYAHVEQTARTRLEAARRKQAEEARARRREGQRGRGPRRRR